MSESEFTSEIAATPDGFSIVIRRNGEHTATLPGFPSREWAESVQGKLAARPEPPEAIQEALDTFRPRVRVRTPRGDGYVMTAPVIGATGQVCFGVRLDAGPGFIAKHDETEVIE